MNNAVVLLAAGQGSRLGLGINKVLLPLKGQPLLYHSLKTFSQITQLQAIVLVIKPGEKPEIQEIVGSFMKKKHIVFAEGGKSRQESVLAGLRALEALKPEKVLIHDGARPFVSRSVILRVLDAISPGQAVTPGINMVDSLRYVDPSGNITSTVDRSCILAVQTPQGFMYEELLKKHQALRNEQQITDDAQLFQKQVLVEGDSRNIKITTRGDYDMYNATSTNIRVGQGYDVHQMISGRDLILGGVKIPSNKGLLGHSDADVLTHAIIDAILGACGLGDIGEHFPDTDVLYKGISSLELLKQVKVMIDNKGVTVNNIDASILAQEPKLSPYKEQMRENIADTLGILKEQVNVKATTTEKLGFVGRCEGIAVLAVATVTV